MPGTGSRQARGYGAEHEKQRKAWAPKVHRGEAYCTRCTLHIAPDDAWDMGHNAERTAWTGPEHASCNRRAGAVASNTARQGLKHSRAW